MLTNYNIINTKMIKTLYIDVKLEEDKENSKTKKKLKN